MKISVIDAAEDVEAVLIATEWPEFRRIDCPRLRSLVQRPLIVDGRNMFDPAEAAAHGFHHLSIGRKTAFSATDDSSAREKRALLVIAQ